MNWAINKIDQVVTSKRATLHTQNLIKYLYFLLIFKFLSSFGYDAKTF
jgi:hypothetical protein